MDTLKELRELKETIANEIAEANKRIRQSGGDMNTADIEIIDKLTHSMKSLATTCAMLEAEDDGYSGSYYYVPENRYGNSREYKTGGSFGDYPRRSNRENRNSYGYSRNGSMMDHLRAMIDEAPDEQTRMEIKMLMDKLNQR